MQDRQLHEQILGIRSPWYVERVELQLVKNGKGAMRAYRDHPTAQAHDTPRPTSAMLAGVAFIASASEK